MDRRIERLEPRMVLSAAPIISEFMASNDGTINDGDGNDSDWIEIYNPTAAEIDLAGWHLTDNDSELSKWTFPDLEQSVLDPGEHLLVFASGQNTSNYVDALGFLHTTFSLKSSGEYLALVEADGTTVAHAYSPQYPQQLTDVSFGVTTESTATALVSAGDNAQVFIPTNDNLGLTWTNPGFTPDASWITESSPGTAATTGVGFDSATSVPNLVAHWTLNDTSGTNGSGSVVDSSGSLHHGTPTGGVNFGISGANTQTGTSVDFSNGSIDVPYSPDLNPASFTFSAWVRPDTGSGFRSVVTSRNDGNPSSGYILYLSSAERWSFWTGKGDASGWEVLDGPNASVGTWQHVAISFDATTQTKELWVNGNLAASSSIQRYGPNPTSDLHIGGGGDLGDQFRFSGNIDDANLFSSALDQSTIQSIMASSLPNSSSASFASDINTDISSQMEGVNASAFVRIPFDVIDPSAFDILQLRMKYDDGFVAYLNGTLIATRNASASPAWNASASASHPDTASVLFEEIDVSDFISELQTGENILAIHALNSSVVDNNLLLVPELIARETSGAISAPGYFLTPTPGEVNPNSTDSIGPHIGTVSHGANAPTVADPLIVTAEVTPAFQTIATVSLHYRVMYGSEIIVSMADNGLGNDLAAGDGIYTGIVPAGVASGGQMLRYYVTAEDAQANSARAPFFVDQRGNSQDPEYYGTVVVDPALNTSLPVWQWFTQNTTNSHNRNGARASVFYQGNFYDNIYVRQRGQATNASQSQKFDFNKGNGLFVDNELGKVGEINMNGRGRDSSSLRQTLSFDITEEIGGRGSKSFLTYMTVNGSFDRVGIFIEQVDEDFLKRQNLDNTGELFKFVQRRNLDPVFTDGVTDGDNGSDSGTSTGIERKTGDQSDLSSVADLIAGLHLPTVQQRENYLLDHFNIANLVDYFAIRALIRDADDIRKNFYVYHDINDTEEWYMLPWDKDFTFGINGDGGPNLPHPFFGEEEHLKENADQWNVLADVLFESPTLQKMYLRRLRTLMDQYLGAPGTPAGASWIEQHTEALYQPAQSLLSGSAKNSVLNYVDQRRSQLYGTYGPGGSEPLIPNVQVAAPTLSIGTIEYNPGSGTQDEEYFVIHNPSSVAVDISDWTVEGAVTHTFSPGTVIAAGGDLYLAHSQAAFRARSTGPTGGQGHQVQRWSNGALSNFGETITIKRGQRAKGSILGDRLLVGCC